MDELQYNTPQDKLLIMLLERISSLEDKIEKQNSSLNQLLSMSSFKYFNINITGKLIDNKYENVEKYILYIIKYIDNKIPIISSWILFGPDFSSCYITIETNKKWQLDTIKENLSLHKNIPVHTGAWDKSDTVWHLSKLFAKKNIDSNEWVMSDH